MEKIKNYENFEVDDDNKDEAISKLRQYHLLAKIVIILSVIIVFQIINLLVIYSSIKETNSDISNINLKKYMLADGNKKLDRALNEDFKKDYAYDEETKKKDNEIKSKEKLIKDYLHKTKKLQKSLNNTQPIEEIIKINNDKKEKINELKSNLYGHVKGFRDHFYTRIIDSSKELNDIKELIKSNIKNNDVNEINLNMDIFKENNPGAKRSEISKERKKYGQPAIERTRDEVGAKGAHLDFTDNEWEAIQNGAIHETTLKKLLRYADIDKVRARATPKERTSITQNQINKIEALKARGKTTAQIAEAVGVSPSTVIRYLKGED